MEEVWLNKIGNIGDENGIKEKGEGQWKREEMEEDEKAKNRKKKQTELWGCVLGKGDPGGGDWNRVACGIARH